MTKLTLTNHAQSTTTVLENEFIDRYMAKANGEYVKVYLLLLRHLHEPSGTLTISEIADKLECTEKDVTRALNYWKKQGLLDYASVAEHSENETAHTEAMPEAKIPVTENHVIEKPVTETATKTDANKTTVKKEVTRFRKNKEFKQLLFVTEQYLGKPLSSTETEAMIYFYENLQMSAELIEYLIEYCVENGHKSMHYIQSVALSWHKQNIRTVSEAKSSSAIYNKNCYSVLNAFGIKGRAPATSEITYIRKWNEDYGFALEIILEACNRTMNAIHQPNFEYTDSILKNWFSKKVSSMKDIAALDADYQKEKEKKKKQTAKPAPANKFNNFESRNYNMNDLELRLLQQ